MSISSRKLSLGEDLDLFGSDSEEESDNQAVENTSFKNLDLSQQADWDRLPLELWVTISCMDVDNYSSLSSLSRTHYHLLNNYWHKQICTHLTEFPELALNESYHHYYTRMVQKIIGELPAPGTSLLDGTDWGDKTTILKKAITFGLEKLVEKIINMFPTSPLTDEQVEERTHKELPVDSFLTVEKCNIFFNRLGKNTGKGKIAIVQMLLTFIDKLSDEWRYKIIVNGCLSFISSNNYRPLKILKKSYIREGKAFSLLWNALPENLRKKLAYGELINSAAENVLPSIEDRMLRLVTLSSALTDIQCILDTYPAEKRLEYVEDAIFFANFFGTLNNTKLLTTISHGMLSLLKVLPDDRRRSVSINAFIAAIVFCTQVPWTINIFRTMSNLPPGFRQHFESLESRGDAHHYAELEVLGDLDDDDEESSEAPPERIHKLLAKALFCVASSCSVEELKEQLSLLEFSPEINRSEVIVRCVAYSIVSDLEIKKITFLLDQLDQVVSSKALGVLLEHAADGIITNPITIKRIIDISSQRNIMENVLRYFLCCYPDETLAYSVKNLLRQFPASLCQQVMKEIVEDTLVKKTDLPLASRFSLQITFVSFLQIYNGEKHLDEVLSAMFIAMAKNNEDEKAKFLLNSIPTSFSFKAPIVYLDQMIKLNRNTDEIVKSFPLSPHHQSAAVATLYSMGVYDAQHGTNVLAFFVKHHPIGREREHTTLNYVLFSKAHFNTIWGALSEEQKVSFVSSRLVALSHQLAELDRPHPHARLADDETMLTHLHECLPLYAGLPIRVRHLALLAAVKRSVEEKKPLKFSHTALNVTLRRYIVTLATVLYNFLEDTWQLDKIKILLNDIQKDHIKHVILYALSLAVVNQKNRMIIALLDLPVALECIEKNALDEMLEFLRGATSPLQDEDKEYLAAVISPQVPAKRQSLAPNLKAAPAHIRFYKSTMDIHVQCNKMLTLLSSSCAVYKQTNNTHAKLAELIMHIIDLFSSEPTEFKLHVVKMLLKSLYRYFEKQPTKDFVSYFDYVRRVHAQLLPGVKIAGEPDQFMQTVLEAFNNVTTVDDTKEVASRLFNEFLASYRPPKVSL